MESTILPPEEIKQRIIHGGHVLVAGTDGRIVGMAAGLDEHEALHVCSAAVEPDCQGQEIAPRLMEVSERTARELG